MHLQTLYDFFIQNYVFMNKSSKGQWIIYFELEHMKENICSLRVLLSLFLTILGKVWKSQMLRITKVEKMKKCSGSVGLLPK